LKETSAKIAINLDSIFTTLPHDLLL
ncbi:MAG: hypothetical protein CG438_1727, partial [Methylococcaceae bacterium NSP1-1]